MSQTFLEDIPEFLEIQRNSFLRILDTGLIEALEAINPISPPPNCEYGLLFYPKEYVLVLPPHTFSQEEAFLQGKTYGCKIYVPAITLNSGTEKEFMSCFAKPASNSLNVLVTRDRKLLPSHKEWVCIGALPLMSRRGHFIINGSPRIVISQMSRAPGLYYQTGEKLQATVVPSKGAWFRMSVKVSKKGETKVWVRITPYRKMPYKIFLETYKNLESPGSFTQSEFLDLAYKSVNSKIKDFDKQYGVGQIRRQINLTIRNSSSYTLGTLGRKRLNERLGDNSQKRYLTTKDISTIKNTLLELLDQKNYTGPADDIDHLENRRVRTCGELLQSEMEVGMSRLKKAIVKQLDSYSNPDSSLFISPKGTTTSSRNSSLKKKDKSVDKDLYKGSVEKNEAATFALCSTKEAKATKGKVALCKPPNPSKIVSTKAFAGALREFFGSNPLSQYMDQTNPLAEITHKRRLSSLGPGGVDRASAGIAIRGIHPTHYGRICPIETPEGKNAGLVNSMTMWARLNRDGFLQTPYLKVKGGSVMTHTLNLSPAWQFVPTKQESCLQENQALKIVASDLRLSKNFLPKIALPTREGSERNFVRRNRDVIDFFGVSPVQNISVATSLIPFLEHDDATRALMGSNMQRQAVPLLKPQAPLVRTGLEGKVVGESGHALQAVSSGFISSATKAAITIDSFTENKNSMGAVAVLATPSLTFRNKYSKAKKASRKLAVASHGGASFAVPAILAEQSKQSKHVTKKANHLLPSVLTTKSKKTQKHTITTYHRVASIEPTSLPFFSGLQLQSKNNTSRNNLFFNSKTSNKQLRAICYASSCKSSGTAFHLLPRASQHLQNKKLKQKQKPTTLTVLAILATFATYYEKIAKKAKAEGLQSKQQSNYIKTYDVKAKALNLSWIKKKQNKHKELTVFAMEKVNQEANSTKKVWRQAAKIQRTREIQTLQQYTRSNQATVCVQRPAVTEGQWVQKGDLLADCSASSRGVLALGQNIVVAYLPMEGFNFEDAIVVSDRLVHEELYTSIHVERVEFDMEAVPKKNILHNKKHSKLKVKANRNTVTAAKTLQQDWITMHNPHLHLREKEALDALGIIKIGSWVGPDDVLVSKVFPVEKTLAPSRHLLLAVFKDKKSELASQLETTDTSVRVPKGIHGRVINIQILYTGKIIPSASLASFALPTILTGLTVLTTSSKKSKKSKQGAEEAKIGKAFITGLTSKDHTQALTYAQHLEPLSVGTIAAFASLPQQALPFPSTNGNSASLSTAKQKNRKSVALASITKGKTEKNIVHSCKDKLTIPLNSAFQLLASYSAKAFAKGATTTTFLKQRNPVTSSQRMRQGSVSSFTKEKYKKQGLEKTVHDKEFKIVQVRVYIAERKKLQVGDKMSGRHGNKGIVSTILPREDMPYLPDGTCVDMVLNPLGIPSRMNVGQVFECLLGLAATVCGDIISHTPFDEMYGPEASRSLVYLFLYSARLRARADWLFQPTFPGKTVLFDGRTGTPFEQWVTVGRAYMLKLIHMVDEKIHARSVGSRSIVTQQPVKGRARGGGQRVGEMEVWAFEGFGAAYTLQELLTIKSDDIFGRERVEDRIISSNTVSAHVPETFKILLFELRCLCLNVELNAKDYPRKI